MRCGHACSPWPGAVVRPDRRILCPRSVLLRWGRGQRGVRLVVAVLGRGGGHGGVAGLVAGAVAALGHQGEDGVKAVWVEVGAAPRFKVAQGPVGWPGRAVGTVGGECVPHVDHGDDAGGQRDLLPGEAVRVAGAGG